MRSLFTKLFLAHLLTLVTALVIFSLLLWTAFESFYLRLAKQQFVARAREIAEEVSPALARGKSEPELRELVRMISVSSRTEVCLTTPRADKESLVGKGPSGQQAHTGGPGLNQAQTGEAMVVSGPAIPCGEDMLLAKVDLPEGRGALYLRAPVYDVVDLYVGQLRHLVWYAGFIAVVISLLVALLVSERISGPLRRMRTLSTRMADGDFSQRLEMRNPDEIGALGRSFDSLADSLQRTMTALHDQQARLRAILASVTDGIVAVDAEGRVSLINPQAGTLLGVEPEQSLGAQVSQLELAEEISSNFTQCLRENRLCSAELELGDPKRAVLLQVAPVRASGQERWGAVGVLRDVSEFRRLDQMRRRFISDASHEIRTPLTAIGGFAAAIADGAATTEEERVRSATLIVREVERLNRLARDLLDLSRIESGSVVLNLQPLNVAELIRDAVAAFETEIRERGLAVELDLPQDLPSVRADSDRLYQVLLNLVSNAVRFNTPQGKIAVAARQNDGEVRVDVSDTGAGIPEDELPHIWERFHRADASRARADGGTGLGLAIARSIIVAHGGAVSAESAVGQGSTLSFTLPI